VDTGKEKGSEATIKEHLLHGASERAAISAFVSIMQGCNQYCTFCIVPTTRGSERYRPADAIVGEVAEMAAGGVREVTLLGQTVNSWFDPGREADAAKSLFDQGADVLSQHTDSTAGMQVAEERGLMAFGQASDMIKFGPNAQLTAIVDDWAPYYVERVKAVMDGTWEQQATWEGMADGAVVMAPFTNMPDDVKAMAEKTTQAITSGELHPFTGPIRKKDGTVWLKAGEVAPDGDLASMNFYVEGIDDSLPE